MVMACVWPDFTTCIDGQACTPRPIFLSTLVNPLPVLPASAADGNVVSEQVPLSIYVIADLDSEDGLRTLQSALAFSVCQFSPCPLLV
jgi:hypothetical protein